MYLSKRLGCRPFVACTRVDHSVVGVQADGEFWNPCYIAVTRSCMLALTISSCVERVRSDGYLR